MMGIIEWMGALWSETWLSLAVGGFLLAMVLWGHYRGFLRMALTTIALVVSLIVVPVIRPYITDGIKENTAIQQALGDMVRELVEERLDGMDEADTISGQESLIDDLALPSQIKEALLEHNQINIYESLGVDHFLDYVGKYLANMILDLVCTVILFIVVFIAIRILLKALNLIAKLPILSGMNQIAGALVGGVHGLLVLWIAALIVKACSDAAWAQLILTQIEESAWLHFLYRNNIFNLILIGILNSLG